MAPPVTLPPAPAVVPSGAPSATAAANAPPPLPPAQAPALPPPDLSPNNKPDSQWASPAFKMKPWTQSPIDGQPGLRLLDDGDQALLRSTFAHASGVERLALVDIVSSPAWQKATPEQRHQLVRLCTALVGVTYDEASKSQGLREATPLAALALCMTDTIHGTPRIFAPGTDKLTTLDHLVRIAAGPLSPALAQRIAPETNRELLAGLVQEIADPRRIDQGNAGMCAPASVQGIAALRMPGEYARIVCSLALDGQVTLANGQVMRADIDGVAKPGFDHRTASERLFQASLAQWAGHERGNYVTRDDGKEGFDDGERTMLWTLPIDAIVLSFILFPLAILFAALKTHKIESGLTSEETRDAAAGVMGEPYEVIDTNKDVLARAAKLRPDLRFDDACACVSFSPFGATGSGHTLVLVGIDKASAPPALICRNPWGSNSAAYKGAPVGQGAPEGTTFEDASAGLIRIPLTPENERSVAELTVPKRLVKA
jgi:hypothetical protein